MRSKRRWESARTLEELQDELLEEPGLFGERRPPLDTPWDQVVVAYLDVETTGLRPDEGDRIVEIAIERVEPGGREERFVEILHPHRGIPEEATRIHAIGPAQIRRARSFDSAAPEILRMLEGAVWVGHNLAFDLRFLRVEMRRCGRELPGGWILDTYPLARRWCRLPRYGLATVAEHLGHGGRNLHQALDDILTTRQVLASLLERITPRPLTLRDTLCAMVPTAKGEE
jgi:DNA polymerase III epsilon subunit-like protein